jgi:hypothetical protein
MAETRCQDVCNNDSINARMVDRMVSNAKKSSNQDIQTGL